MMIKKGVSFDDIHSYEDFNLILSSAIVSPAKPKTTYIDIPGGDGTIDLTNVHGEVKYQDRDCEFIFTMNPSGDLSVTAWEKKKTEVSNLLNGKRCKITLDKDPDYYYTGRCTVDDYKSDKRIHQIAVKAKASPYKLKQTETVRTFKLSETARTVTIENARKPVIPAIECSDDNCKVKFGNYSATMNAGTHKFLEIRFEHGDNVLEISGTGTVTFTFQEGDL